jgi:AraC-like DNA-binding protein
VVFWVALVRLATRVPVIPARLTCAAGVAALGAGTAQAVARELAVSTRTLQRRLHAERTSFQAVRTATRESLARHYLGQGRLSGAEIAFLLGYGEPTSFYRRSTAGPAGPRNGSAPSGTRPARHPISRHLSLTRTRSPRTYPP